MIYFFFDTYLAFEGSSSEESSMGFGLLLFYFFYSLRLKSFLDNFLTAFLSFEAGSDWKPRPERLLAF